LPEKMETFDWIIVSSFPLEVKEAVKELDKYDLKLNYGKFIKDPQNFYNGLEETFININNVLKNNDYKTFEYVSYMNKANETVQNADVFIKDVSKAIADELGESVQLINNNSFQWFDRDFYQTNTSPKKSALQVEQVQFNQLALNNPAGVKLKGGAQGNVVDLNSKEFAEFKAALSDPNQDVDFGIGLGPLGITPVWMYNGVPYQIDLENSSDDIQNGFSQFYEAFAEVVPYSNDAALKNDFMLRSYLNENKADRDFHNLMTIEFANFSNSANQDEFTRTYNLSNGAKANVTFKKNSQGQSLIEYKVLAKDGTVQYQTNALDTYSLALQLYKTRWSNGKQ